MKIGILQHNYIVGDCAGNAQKIIEGYKKLVALGAELVVTSELAILGYPPKDLLEVDSKLQEQFRALARIRQCVGEVGLILGLAELSATEGKPLLNMAVFIRNGRIDGYRTKQLLPTYDVFDEHRYFEPGREESTVVEHNGKRVGLLVCEEAWSGTENPNGQKLYHIDPVVALRERKPDLVIVINASPYYWGKGKVRHKLVSDMAVGLGCPVVYVNQVGGNDDLVFDGRSFVLNCNAFCNAALNPFVEEEQIVDTESKHVDLNYMNDEGDLEQLYAALVLGTRDYLAKTGYKKVVIGESGGIDSALTTCIAVDAVGAENVTGITMPSKFSSAGSFMDSAKLCENLGVRCHMLSIARLYDLFGQEVEEIIGWNDPSKFGNDVTEENVQARLRGMNLMAYSNRKGAMVLSTGNKSELAVGYCTLYGDMVGGLAVISDVPKTIVYKLARWVNETKGSPIPQSIIDKAPSAELRPGQVDQNTLPPYDILDAILHLHVEENLEYDEIVARGLPADSVKFVIDRVRGNEYKRQQAAKGLKVTTKAFGSGRRFPIAMKPRILSSSTVS